MSNQASYVRYRVALSLMLAAALAYLCRNSIGVAESTIREELQLNTDQMGWVMGAFFWTYALFQVPAARFAQKNGTRIALALFAFVWGIAMIGVGLAHGIWLLIIAQLAMGTAQSGMFPAVCNSVGHWSPQSERSFISGITVAGMQIGAIAASFLTGFLIVPLGWRFTFVLFALPSLLWALQFYWRFRDYPEQDAAVSPSELAMIQSVEGEVSPPNRTEATQKTNWFAISCNGTVLMMCGQQICRAYGYSFFVTWFPTFLQQVHGVSLESSAYLQGVVLGGTLIGGIIGGYAMDWAWKITGGALRSRTIAASIALGVSGVLILGCWFVSDMRVGIALLAIGSLFAAIAAPAVYTTVIEISGSRVPQVFGLLNMVGNLAVVACTIIVGKVFSATENWNQVLLMFAGIYIAGAVCWLFVDTRTRLEGE